LQLQKHATSACALVPWDIAGVRHLCGPRFPNLMCYEEAKMRGIALT
jgi:hypothetical protein